MKKFGFKTEMILIWVFRYQPETTKIFVAADDFSLYNLVLCLRNDGFEVESSWPEPDSVQCDDEMLCTIMTVIQKMDMVRSFVAGDTTF